jgi:bacterioferritin-associated ferredoxin
MFVCHCRAVTDSRILEAIAAGAEDEVDIARMCGAGSRCGSCHDELRRLCGVARVAAVTEKGDRALVAV